MTQSAFAAALGVSRQTVAMWESGNRHPDEKRVNDWANDGREWVRLLSVNVKLAIANQHEQEAITLRKSIASTEAAPAP